MTSWRRGRCSTNTLTREWLQKAQSDIDTARREYRVTDDPNLDAAAFHAQQAAEKFIKALLQDRRIDFPKTHNLVELVRLLAPPEPRLVEMTEALGELSAMAVEVRYPGATMSAARAAKACETAERVRQICLELLGLQP